MHLMNYMLIAPEPLSGAPASETGMYPCFKTQLGPFDSANSLMTR